MTERPEHRPEHAELVKESGDFVLRVEVPRSAEERRMTEEVLERVGGLIDRARTSPNPKVLAVLRNNLESLEFTFDVAESDPLDDTQV